MCFYSNLIFGSNHDGILEQRAKSRLIPGGEYLPYTADFALTLVGNQTKEIFKQNRAIARGQYNPTPLTANNTLRLGSSVCAGIIAPGDYQQFTKHGATILTNSAALGIFKSGLFTVEHRGMASFMATANARPFVQAANEADAFILNQNGNMVAHASPGGSLLAEAYVTTNARKTPYSIIGDWPVFVGFLIFTFLTVKKSAHIFVQK